MHTRRNFLTALGAGAIVLPLTLQAETQAAQRKRLAVITTEWRPISHAWHMAERFLHGYPINGRWHRPPLDVVAAYVDQKPENDLECAGGPRNLASPIYPTIAETLRCGGNKHGCRWSIDHRRAWQLSQERVRADEVSALRILQTGHGRISAAMAEHCACLQRQASFVEVGMGESRWSTFPES